jgi:copper chaperone CopZ
LFVPDAIDANCAFKIKSVLQDNDAIYKVEHSDFKNFTVYFDSGQNVDLDLIKTIVTAAGYNPQIKP